MLVVFRLLAKNEFHQETEIHQYLATSTYYLYNKPMQCNYISALPY